MHSFKRHARRTLLTFIISACATCSVPALADSVVLEFNGHHYQRIDTDMSWTQAKSTCEAKGAHLATITSQAEQKFVYDSLSAPVAKNLWLGGTDSGHEGTWTWITGEAFTYTNWAQGVMSLS